MDFELKKYNVIKNEKKVEKLNSLSTVLSLNTYMFLKKTVYVAGTISPFHRASVWMCVFYFNVATSLGGSISTAAQIKPPTQKKEDLEKELDTNRQQRHKNK